MRLMIALLTFACAGCVTDGCATNDAVVQELRKTQAVQAVELKDTRERIHVLEMDMDRIAPHQLPAK